MKLTVMTLALGLSLGLAAGAPNPASAQGNVAAPKPKSAAPAEPSNATQTDAADASADVTSLNPQSLVNALADLEYFANLEPYDNGRPRVRARIGSWRVSIAHYGCENDMTGCRSLVFIAGFTADNPVELAALDAWNRSHLYSRALFDKDGNPYLEMPVVEARSLSHEAFERIVKLWRNDVTDFADEVVFPPT